ncbi:hypothetical protein LIER_13745 [Lithospermum erythrorhizon]|uniref:Two-component response regulator-like APRR2 n=1 Tax=Lithospermum erythrorhizon TaxID=34254 RepID=A0AAV3Q0Q5_LITER
MVCTANDILEGWKDFPKGLKVLLLYQDCNFAAEMKLRLEQMDYVVNVFCNEAEALSAVSCKSQTYHIAIVEVSKSNNDAIFRFLETAKELPTIMTSNINCLSTMMKCIELGALEFLQTPLSDDKLRNIWQHVAHKAFNDNRKKEACDYLEPVKESACSLHQSPDGEADGINHTVKSEGSTVQQENINLYSGGDKYPAPSTPQLKQVARLPDHGDCQDQTEDSKSVDTICCNSATENACYTSSKLQMEEVGVKEEHQSADKSEIIARRSSLPKDPSSVPCTSSIDLKKSSQPPNSSGSKSNRKKLKVEWTPELHKKFIHAVEQLGVDHAIPSRILELMKVEGLTRHNVASHLQKYRMQRRHILPKEEERRWPNPRDSARRSYYPYKPIMTYPPYHPNSVMPPNHQGYPAWLPPASSHPNGVTMQGSHYYPAWQPAENWHWGSYPGMHADAWGCPVMPPAQPSFTPYHQNAYDYRGSHAIHTRGSMVHNLDLHPPEEAIDKVVKEAISKPYLPLPLGLKPPSTESVLNELSKQGIHLHHHPSY